jgi:hypothetical protein
MDDLHYALFNALRMVGGCLCALNYDLKVVGEKCLKCRAEEAFELRRAAEAAQKEKK